MSKPLPDELRLAVTQLQQAQRDDLEQWAELFLALGQAIALAEHGPTSHGQPMPVLVAALHRCADLEYELTGEVGSAIGEALDLLDPDGRGRGGPNEGEPAPAAEPESPPLTADDYSLAHQERIATALEKIARQLAGWDDGGRLDVAVHDRGGS